MKTDIQKFTDSQLLEVQSFVNEQVAFRQLPNDIAYAVEPKDSIIEEQSFTDIQRLCSRVNELTGSLHYTDNKVIDLVNWYISIEERISQLEEISNNHYESISNNTGDIGNSRVLIRGLEQYTSDNEKFNKQCFEAINKDMIDIQNKTNEVYELVVKIFAKNKHRKKK